MIVRRLLIAKDHQVWGFCTPAWEFVYPNIGSNLGGGSNRLSRFLGGVPNEDK